MLVGLDGRGQDRRWGSAAPPRWDGPSSTPTSWSAVTAGVSVAEIFAAQGEAGFRALERTAVADVCASPEPLVIACGGGAVLDPDNRAAAARRTASSCGCAPAPTSSRDARRHGEGRPLLQGGAPAATLARLAELRTPAYEAAAHVIVDTDGLHGADAVTDRVLEEFRSWNA